MSDPARAGFRARLGTVRVRITLLATAIVAVALVAGAVLVIGVLSAGIVHSAAGTGPSRAAEVAAMAARGPLPSPLPPVDSTRLTLVQVLDADGNVMTASSQLQNTPGLVGTGTRRHRIRRDVPGLGHGPWLVETAPATLANRPATVVVVTSVTDLVRGARLVGGLLAVAVPVLVVLVALLVWLVVGRALRPVDAMRAEVADITSRNLDRRVPVPATTDEIARLASTLNDMLDRLEVSAQRQRRFVADASHELRSPVANIRTAVEVAAAHPDQADWAEVAADVLHQEARMERITDDLVLLCRTDEPGVAPQRERVDLADLISGELRRPVPEGRRLEPAGRLPSVAVTADRHQLERALTNLVDNALRHADDRVRVGLAAGTTWAEITVVDDGPGIPPADRERVFDRFVRLDEHRSRTDGGSGLGLPIVRELVTANGGTVHVAEAGPGATVVVRLPLAVNGTAS